MRHIELRHATCIVLGAGIPEVISGRLAMLSNDVSLPGAHAASTFSVLNWAATFFCSASDFSLALALASRWRSVTARTWRAISCRDSVDRVLAKPAASGGAFPGSRPVLTGCATADSPFASAGLETARCRITIVTASSATTTAPAINRGNVFLLVCMDCDMEVLYSLKSTAKGACRLPSWMAIRTGSSRFTNEKRRLLGVPLFRYQA